MEFVVIVNKESRVRMKVPSDVIRIIQTVNIEMAVFLLVNKTNNNNNSNDYIPIYVQHFLTNNQTIHLGHVMFCVRSNTP